MQRLPFLGELAIGTLVPRALNYDALDHLPPLDDSYAERIAGEVSTELAIGVLDELYMDMFSELAERGYGNYKSKILAGSDVPFVGRVDADLEVEQTSDAQYKVTTSVRLRDLSSIPESDIDKKRLFEKEVDMRWVREEQEASQRILQQYEDQYKTQQKRWLTVEENAEVDRLLHEATFGEKSVCPQSAEVLRELGMGPYNGRFDLTAFQKPLTRFGAWMRRFNAAARAKGMKRHLTKQIQTVVLGRVFQEHLQEAITGLIWRPGAPAFERLRQEQSKKRRGEY